MLTAHLLIPFTGTSDDCNTVPSRPSSSLPPPLPPSRRMEKDSAARHPFRCVINDKWHAYSYAPPFNLSSSSLRHNGRRHSSDRRKQLHRLHCMKVNRSQRIQPVHHRLRPIHNSHSHLDMSDPKTFAAYSASPPPPALEASVASAYQWILLVSSITCI